MLAALLLLVSTHAFATRFSMSVVAQQLQADAGLTDIQVGSLLSAFIVGYAIPQLPVGILVDRLGAFRVLSVAAFGWSLFTLSSAPLGWLPGALLATGLFVTRLVSGVFQSGVLTCIIKMLGRWMPPAERSSANGLSMMGLGLGGALTPPAAVALIAWGGWTAPFWVLGLAGLAIAALLRLGGREFPGQHPRVNAAELSLIGSGQTPDPARPGTPWRALASNRSVIALALSYGVSGYTSYLFFTWFYLYLVNVRGMTKQAGGYWAGLPYVAVALGTLAGGRLSDRISRRFGKRAGRLSVVLAGECVAAALIVMGGRVENVSIAVCLLALAAGFHLFGQTSSWAAAVDLAPTHAGALFGAMNTLAQIAGAIAPIATPALARQFGWTAALDFSAGLVVLAAISWTAVNVNQPAVPAH